MEDTSRRSAWLRTDDDFPHVDCIVKIGGAAVTVKDKFETLNDDILDRTADQIKRLLDQGLKFILVHGAGSFGHFQAAAGSIAQGGVDLTREKVLKHFAETRLSVTKLNNMIVESLLQRDIPAVGVSPFCSWTTGKRQVMEDGCKHIAWIVQSGLLPVLHGDAVLDYNLKYNILGGDPIMTTLCEKFKPQRAIFLTNVDGVFDRPPGNAGSQLLRQIIVDRNGFFVGYTSNGEVIDTISMSELEHDTTGGVRAKVKEAVAVVRADMHCSVVRVAKAGSTAAVEACSLIEVPDDWIGTEIKVAFSEDGQGKPR